MGFICWQPSCVATVNPGDLPQITLRELERYLLGLREQYNLKGGVPDGVFIYPRQDGFPGGALMYQLLESTEYLNQILKGLRQGDPQQVRFYYIRYV